MPVFSQGSENTYVAQIDGYRIQLIKHGRDVGLFSKNGHEFTSRFPTVAYLAQSIPARSAIIDAELVASDRGGQPNFYKLLTARNEPSDLHLWAFDLLHLNGRDLLDQPLKTRMVRLERLVQRTDCPVVLFSELRGSAASARRMRDAPSRGHCQQARRRAVSVRPSDRLGEGEVGRLARG
jgi:ATP-dependent DNA ligase